MFVDHAFEVDKKVQGWFPLCDANLLSIGTTSRARARGKTRGEYCSSKIGAINKNGTYDIDFDDGDRRENAPLNTITVR